MDIRLTQTALDNVYVLEFDGKKRIATKNLVPGKVYGEKTVTTGNEEYRIWNPFRSKLAAMIVKGSSVPLKKDSTVLYLGAANGTTASHVSDIVSEGMVFAVEFSPRAMKDLIRVSTHRINLIPILADATHPDSYGNMVPEVDVIYQDIAQREQARIAVMNAELFLKKEGFLIFIIKSRSVDSTKKTKEIINNEVHKLNRIFEINGSTNLEPFYSDHCAVLAQKLK